MTTDNDPISDDNVMRKEIFVLALCSAQYEYDGKI